MEKNVFGKEDMFGKVRWPVRAIPLPICEFPKNDFSKQLLFQTATFPNSDFYMNFL